MASAPPQSASIHSYEGIVSRLLQLAARVGRHGNDGVDVSYTSLFIALLWLEDDTSKWLNENAGPLGARLSAVYKTRGVTESDRAPLRAAAFSTDELNPLSYSPSARRIMAAAQAVADESSPSAPGVVGTRHIAAVYFFRNPPDHQTQLEDEWAFAPAKWRPSFVEFIRASRGDGDLWRAVFAPHLDPSFLEEFQTPLLERYQFAGDALRVLEDWWERSEYDGRSRRRLRSIGLLEAMRGPESFGEFGAPEPSQEPSSPLLLNNPVFLSSGSRLVLDGAQSLAFTTTGSAEIGLRHLAAAVVLVKESNAHGALLASGKPLSYHKRRLLAYVNRHCLDDEAAEWRKALVGQREPDLAAYRPDDPEAGNDQLDVRRFAAAFALLIASKEVAPPLAIGISGNWGSGKSFFMRLMRSETDRIARLAEADPRFHSNVVPIQFNAWHYAEKDLLASLVQTIFQALQNALTGPRGAPSDAEAVLSRLETAKAERDSAEKQAEAARAAFEISQKQLEETRRQVALKAEQVRLSAAGVAAASAEQLKPALVSLGLGHISALIDQGADRAAQVRAALAHVQSTGLRSRSAFEWLLRAPVSWWGVAGLLLALVLAAAAAYFFQNSLAALTPILAALGAVWRWASRQLARIDEGLAEFDKVRHAIDAKAEEKRAELNKDIEAAQRELDEHAAALKTAQESLAAASAKVAGAERALEETKSINLLARMVGERLTSRDYEKYLGLVAAVRADFQRLSELIRAAAQEASASNLSFRRIDRIVLYIDDLDRCPTDKVVLVLEAIHLLLAFDLFVVVVGLDIRWASHSLEEKFSRQLKAENGASALDYLEKIFQIPFWLPPMDEQASRQLLTAMLPRPQPAAGESSAAATGASAAAAPAGAGKSGPLSKAPVSAPLPGETELLSIQRGERAFMLSLAPALSRSPRRLKRFVNTYLILRASLAPDERETFVLDGGASGNYREAMVLLAMLTSAPRAWTRALNALDSPAPPQSVGDLRKIALTEPAPGEYQYVEALFDAYGSNGSIEELRTMAPKVARFSFHYSFT
jgi:hypothetical protein